MNTDRGTLKPWSQFDEEFATAEPGAGAFALEAPGAVEPTGETGSREKSTSQTGRSANALLTPLWAGGAILASLIWSVMAMIFARRPDGGIGLPHVVGVVALNLIAGLWLVAAHRSRRQSLASMRRAIATSIGRRPPVFEDSSLGAEMRQIWRVVESHSANADRRVAELQESQKHLSLELSLAGTQRRQSAAIMDAISDPVLVTDAFDQLVLANPAAGELFQFDRQTALRKPIAEVVGDEKLVRTIRQAREADSRAARRRLEHEIAGRFYAVTLAPVAAESGASQGANGHHGVVIVLRDVTKDHEASRMKSEFVAQVAHELRTPLSSIRAYVEMLVDGEAVDEKTRREYYDIIQTSAHRLGRLIDNILNISRIEAGTVRINKEPVAVSMIVREAADTLRPQAEAKGITLTQELAPVVDRIMGDRDLILQAVLNLISNAIKYTPDGGQVAVRMIGVPERYAMRIEVSDTGVGIPKEDLPRMFEKFFRVEANKNVAAGTGLGLNLVKKIVEKVHEGEMSLTSEVGRGSTFVMTLPLMR